MENPGDELAATPAFAEGFEDIRTLPAKGWFLQNNSTPPGLTGWFQGNPTVFPAQAGPANSYIAANFNNTIGDNTISNWLLTPVIEFRTGDRITFYTRTESNAQFPDRLQIRLSTNGASTNVGTGATGVGDFTRLLLDINPNYVAGRSGGYPVVWTQFTIIISRLSGATSGRLAFRYFVENGGLNGDNSQYIGIDTFAYTPTAGGGNPTPTPRGGTPIPTTTPTPRGGTPTPTPTPMRDAPVDFNGDGRTDYAVTRNVGGANGMGNIPANQIRWFYNINGSNAATVALDWGLASDTVVPEDYDGDNRDDIAVWRPGAPNVAAFYILNSATNTARVELFGQGGDDPTVVGDYTGDGRADLAVYREGAIFGAQSIWFYRATPSGPTSFIPWGLRGDFPAPGDYDGDGRNDFVIQRFNGEGQEAAFWTRLATGVVLPVQSFGRPTDFIVPGDYDADGRTDIATVRFTSIGTQWFWRRSSDQVLIGPVTFGLPPLDGRLQDLPVQGDYDGDGRTDVAVWRIADGLFISRSTVTGAVSFFKLGSPGDFPVALYNVH